MRSGGTGGPLTVWVVSGGREMATDTQPLLENEVYTASRGTVELSAAINETVALQVGLRAVNPPAGPFNVRVTDLEGPHGRLTAHATVSIYRVHYTPVEQFDSWYPARTGQATAPQDFPNILVPWEAPRGGGPLRLDQKRNEIIWIDLHVPLTTDPGVYVGRLELARAQEDVPVFSCRVRLSVVPVAIPSARGTATAGRVDPRDLLGEHLNWPRVSAEETRIVPDAPTHQAARRLVDATMRLFHEHRATPLLWAGFPKYRLAADRSVVIDWDTYDRVVTGWLDGDAFDDRVGLAR